MKTKKESKTELIRFRITSKEKEKLIHAAKLKKESLSSYILKRSLQEYPNPFHSFPQIIDTNNLFNEIYHLIEKNGNETLTQEIISLYHKHISTFGERNNIL